MSYKINKAHRENLTQQRGKSKTRSWKEEKEKGDCDRLDRMNETRLSSTMLNCQAIEIPSVSGFLQALPKISKNEKHLEIFVLFWSLGIAMFRVSEKHWKYFLSLYYELSAM